MIDNNNILLIIVNSSVLLDIAKTSPRVRYRTNNQAIMYGRTGFSLALAIQLLLPISVFGLSNVAPKVKHVVMFTLQDDVSEEKVKGAY